MNPADSSGRIHDQVLLVDDSPANLQVLHHTLEGGDYRLLVAGDGAQALRIARKADPTLMLLDVLMPGIDGYEVCRRLKADPATADIAVIFLSALSESCDKVRGFELGAVDFISKPFQPEEVMARVAAQLKIRRLEQGLLRRNRQLELVRDRILQAMGEGIFGLDHEGRGIFVNQAASRLSGWSEEELVGRILDHQEATEGPGPLAGSQVRGALVDGQMRFIESGHFRRRDGSRFPVEYSIAPTLESGQVTGAVVVFRDLSERARAQAELKRAHAALLRSHRELGEAQKRLIQAAKLESVGRLAAGVAHEVKNPLAVIQLGVDYLEGVLPEDPTTAVVLADMSGAVTRADSVIKGLLDFSREHRLELRPMGINEIIRDSLQLVQHELTQHNIRLLLDLEQGVPVIDLDPHRLQQVFVNLFMNAVHAMERDGILRVQTRFEILDRAALHREPPPEGFESGEPVIRVSVEDTGCGLSDEGRQQLFDPFFTTKPPGQGTGLGLSVSHNIIKLHKGGIQLRNRDGGGAVATILLKTPKGHEDAKEEDTPGGRRTQPDTDDAPQSGGDRTV